MHLTKWNQLTTHGSLFALVHNFLNKVALFKYQMFFPVSRRNIIGTVTPNQSITVLPSDPDQVKKLPAGACVMPSACDGLCGLVAYSLLMGVAGLLAWPKLPQKRTDFRQAVLQLPSGYFANFQPISLELSIKDKRAFF